MPRRWFGSSSDHVHVTARRTHTPLHSFPCGRFGRQQSETVPLRPNQRNQPSEENQTGERTSRVSEPDHTSSSHSHSNIYILLNALDVFKGNLHKGQALAYLFSSVVPGANSDGVWFISSHACLTYVYNKAIELRVILQLHNKQLNVITAQSDFPAGRNAV